METIKVGIVGISGYSGGILLEHLLKHPQVRVAYISANNTKGKASEIWPQLRGLTDLYCNTYDLKKALECDCIFLAVPHTVAMGIVPDLLKAKKKIIDLSADYRHLDAEVFEQWYGTDHKDKENLAKAVYGLPELYREKIKHADLIANPGCYPTAAILALAPIAATQSKSMSSIVIDAKSGVTGAGRKAATTLMFSEVNENFKAYKVLKHQHVPEIDDHLSRLANRPIEVTFIPHLIPINRGILETIYVQFKNIEALDDIHNVYRKFYKTEPFVRVLDGGQYPEIKDVSHTNYCDIGLAINEKKGLLIVIAAIDNLLKGASGQAIQNMNIMYGFEESLGLQ